MSTSTTTIGTAASSAPTAVPPRPGRPPAPEGAPSLPRHVGRGRGPPAPSTRATGPAPARGSRVFTGPGRGCHVAARCTETA
ncbi:hypothetical protein FTX61_13285 [Nitriliruptoraceae bacterium ZYF776]|nr:hypothetical protein [Profundirhabdus halotolerans]